MNATIRVGHLPYGFSEQDVRALFEGLGEVRSVELSGDWTQTRIRPQAEVELFTDDVDRAIRQLDGKNVRGKPLMVNTIVPRLDTRTFHER